MDIKTRIGIRIRALRREARMTQAQLADAIGRSVEAVSLIERGQTLATVETLTRLSGALNVPVAELTAATGPVRSASADRVLAEISAILSRLSDDELQTALRVLHALPRSNQN